MKVRDTANYRLNRAYAKFRLKHNIEENQLIPTVILGSKDYREITKLGLSACKVFVNYKKKKNKKYFIDFSLK